MIHQTNIECFLSLAETLNFTQTAKQLYLTQQAVSKSIAQLEKEFGFPLFQRKYHSVSLTEAGERCHQILSRTYVELTAEIMKYRAQYQKASAARTLKIGYQTWLDFGDAPSRALSRLLPLHDGLTFTAGRFTPPSLRNRLQAGQLDIALLYESFFDTLDFKRVLLKKTPLFQVPMAIFVSANDPRATDEATLADFREDPLIFDVFEQESPQENERRAATTIERCNLNPQKILIMPNRESGYTAAEMGQGLIVSSELNIMSLNRNLKKYLADTSETVVCIYRDDADSLISDYVQFLTEEYNN